MAQSMTGFGAARFTSGGAVFRIELRSVNHRHLDVRVRAAREAAALEPVVTAALRKRLVRGHVEASITRERTGEGGGQALVDVELARAYYQAFEALRFQFGLSQPVTIDFVLGAPGVLSGVGDGAGPETLLADAADAVDAAIGALVEMRRAEGKGLSDDLTARLARLEDIAGRISEEAKTILSEGRERLQRRVAEMLAGTGTEPDAGRLEHEIVFLADRLDVTEELVRLRAHLRAARLALESEATPGRRLEFLAQELLREVNTIGSKSTRLAIVEWVVEAKVELEKIREQAANLE